MSRRVWAHLSGEGLLAEGVSYDVDVTEHGEGETWSVDLTFDLGGLSLTIDFDAEAAEEFLVEFRDEVARAKQAQLEWETDTGPGASADDADG